MRWMNFFLLGNSRGLGEETGKGEMREFYGNFDKMLGNEG
jgi:hypothetical protein